MPDNILIQAIAAETPLGNLDQLWNRWLNSLYSPRLAGGNASQPQQSPDNWQSRTNAVTQQIAAILNHTDRISTGLILATTKADIQSQTQWMRCPHDSAIGNRQSAIPPLPTLASEAHRLANIAAVHAPAYAVSTACTSGLSAIIDAVLSLLTGDAQKMIVIGADDTTDFVSDGFHSLKAISPTTCKPFDKNRDGLTLGSAAAALLLTLSPCHQVTKSSPAITGWGISNDATHMTAPDIKAAGLIRAIEQALHTAKLNPEEIDVLLAHGTGTKYNDAMEALAIHKIFHHNNRKGPAVTALKSLLGHTLGASGVIELALAAKIIEHQIIPGIINLQSPEFPEIDFVTSPRNSPVRHILKTASGFGGFNAAIILSAP